MGNHYKISHCNYSWFLKCLSVCRTYWSVSCPPFPPLKESLSAAFVTEVPTNCHFFHLHLCGKKVSACFWCACHAAGKIRAETLAMVVSLDNPLRILLEMKPLCFDLSCDQMSSLPQHCCFPHWIFLDRHICWASPSCCHAGHPQPQHAVTRQRRKSDVCRRE